ncbi:MAG: c-type cytochrome [Gammaproteobacteria bacterium]|nr:c-type cytochrome [Gammaproteobacteria bacterium]
MASYSKVVAVLVLASIGLSACTDDKEKEQQSSVTPSGPLTEPTQQVPASRFSLESIARGAATFQANCAECHGPDAQGHPDWSPEQASGKREVIVAPPLDGTGLTWRRSREDIAGIIKNGIRRNNFPVMPAWKGRVKDSDIEDVISWFQALWPQEVYDRWQKAQTSTAGNKGS